MNFASWVILGVVIVVLGFAIKATFFKKSRRGGCCDKGDDPEDYRIVMEKCGYTEANGCGGCTACNGMAARNNLQPIYKPVDKPEGEQE